MSMDNERRLLSRRNWEERVILRKALLGFNPLIF